MTAFLKMFMAMQQVGMLGVMSEVRDPLTEVAPHRQRSDSLAPDSAAFAKSSEKRRGLEKPHRELSRAPPKTGQAGYSVRSSSKEPHRPDLAEALHSASQQVCTGLDSSPMAAAIDRLMCIAWTATLMNLTTASSFHVPPMVCFLPVTAGSSYSNVVLQASCPL